MYFIQEGLGKKWVPLAIFFAIAGTFGATPIFQTHQTINAIKDIVLTPYGVEASLGVDLMLGVGVAVVVALVIFGGISRIGAVASRLVPAMVVLYIGSVIYILVTYASEVIPAFALIVTDAFTAQAAMGGAVGALIITGARRAAFSNEAGIGTAPMMHGAAKTNEPIREGLVAMLGPAIDTLLVCTMTGLCILVTDAWKSGDLNGITLTAKAFEISMPTVGPFILLICVLIFAITTIFGLAYYGKICFSYLVGVKYGALFDYWYVMLVVLAAVISFDIVVYFVDLAYGLMAFPTIIGAVMLAPKVRQAADRYFSALRAK